VVKRIAVFLSLVACIGLSFFLSVPTRTASAQTGQIELACPAGSSPMPIVGQTFNISTGKFRQWLCVDTNGNITQATGVGASPGGANTNVQFNNAGAFGGTSSFTYDGATTVSIGNGGAGALVVNSSSSPSATGAIRLPIPLGLAKTGIGWRNNANSADLILVPNTSDQLTFNGSVISTGAVSTVVYSTPSASTSASIAATTMATAGASGNTYRVSLFGEQTVLGTGCTGNSTVVFNVLFTTPSAAAQTTLSSSTHTFITNGTVGQMIGSGLTPPNPPVTLVIRAKASTAVQYSTTYTPGTGCAPGPAYQVYPILEQLN
jgi:hypothetical protein